MCNMAETGYQPAPHDAAFRKALLAKPGVKKAYDALEEEYTALHAMLAAQRKAFAFVCHAAQIRSGLRQEADDSDGLTG
jgi:hypothetical protein